MQPTNFQELEISQTEAAEIASQYFGVHGVATRLPGEVDFNYKLKTHDDTVYLLKISRPNIDTEELDFQADIIRHLSSQNLPFQIPEVIPANDGSLRSSIPDDNKKIRWARLHKWVSGRMVADVNPRSAELLASWGRSCGQLSKALQNYDHPVAHRFYKWNPSETLFSRKYQQYIQGEEEKEITDYFWNLFQHKTLPELSGLRKSVNYNDAHEHNLLAGGELSNPVIAGVIDFGDSLYTHTVNELAIGAAYAGMYLPDPLSAMAQLVKGYHDVFPLEEKEVELLFSLISARLLITVSNAAWNKQREPGNDYLVISERPAWELLKKLRNIPPALAHFSFRRACGWEPCPARLKFHKWLDDGQNLFTPPVAIANKSTTHLDLSVGSLELGNNSSFDTNKAFQRTIDRMLEEADATIGAGGYGEVRPFYTTDAYQVEGNNGVQWRTVHLGLDLWDSAGVPVYAPLAGKIHSIANNEGDCNYGPTIILEHKVSDALTFYTLYGHLSISSLEGLSAGMAIDKGQQIATFGAAAENGNWPPHLHFQIMLDMLDMKGDFPGVAFPADRDVWLSICPNPHLLFPDITASKNTDQHSAKEILDSRSRLLGKSLSISYQQPLHIVRGYKQYLYDITARRYLDTVNNVAHVGHEHPRVVRAAQRQVAVLNTNTRYLHDNIIQFAEALLQTLPPELSVVHFVNSGSEANELALRMVKAYNGQKDMIAIEAGYHGNTGGCIDISSYKFDGRGGKGAPPHTHIVPIPDTYRGLYRDSASAADQYAAHVQSAIENIQAQGRNAGGFIAESILSCGGQIVLPEGYLRKAYAAVRAAGGLCIADEVQVGFGRSGEKFWAFELQGVVPDIVTMGKPIGNGHPLAAVVTTREVAAAFANGMEYFNTFGGNPVSCAIGREVLQVIKDEALQQNALDTGNYLKQRLLELQQRHPIIGDVRGPGFFQGIELVNDRETLSPAAAQASYLADRIRARGILMSTDGPFHNVLKIKPPMCFNKSNADFLIANLDRILGEEFMRR